jgi:hypothetical protein
MGYDHAAARVNLRPLYSLANALPVQPEHFISSGSKLHRIFLIGLGAPNSLGCPGSASERFHHSFVVAFDSAIKLSGDRVFPPICRAPAETGEADIADRDHIRMNQVEEVL